MKKVSIWVLAILIGLLLFKSQVSGVPSNKPHNNNSNNSNSNSNNSNSNNNNSNANNNANNNSNNSNNSNNNNNSNNPNNPQGNTNKVTICHRTNSVTNPYVVITVDTSAADGVAGNSGHQPDHFGEHKGPLFDANNPPPPPHNGDQWGDIIPPIPPYHSGLNWTAQGQAFYNNNCNSASVNNPTNTPTPGGVGGNGGSGGGSSSSQGGGQVLGTKKLAPTGSFEDNLMATLLLLGFSSLFYSKKLYAKKA